MLGWKIDIALSHFFDMLSFKLLQCLIEEMTEFITKEHKTHKLESFSPMYVYTYFWAKSCPFLRNSKFGPLFVALQVTMISLVAPDYPLLPPWFPAAIPPPAEPAFYLPAVLFRFFYFLDPPIISIQ